MLSITLLWFKNSQSQIKVSKINHNKKFIIIIPVLREQKVLEKTVNHFLMMNYDLRKMDIILVSTEKEIQEAKDSNANKKTTIDLIKELKQRINKKYHRKIIIHLHYPSATGKMAHQVNYAFECVLKVYKHNLTNIFVALYNADSRPHLNTLSAISILTLNNNLRVFQQSALFFDNFSTIIANNNFFVRQYLISNAILHSRWTLAHEIPRLLRQSFFINNFNKRIFLTHCVGHGLFLRGDFLKKIKMMPTTTVTEDLFFGYILSLLGESVNPVPLLENAEAPRTFLSSLKQKYVWFFGPMDHFNYEDFFRKRFPKKANFFLLKWFTLQGILPAVAWFLMGWLFLFILSYPLIVHNNKLLLWSLLLFLFYGPFSYVIVLWASKKINRSIKVQPLDYFWLILFNLPVIFIHSLPPILSVIVKIKHFCTGNEPPKPKTER